MNICVILMLATGFIHTTAYTILGKCDTPDGKPGACVYLHECKNLLQLYERSLEYNRTENYDKLSNSQCGFQNNKVLVCCEDPYNDLLPSCDEGWKLKGDLPVRCGYFGKIMDVGEQPWMALIVSYNCSNRDCDPYYPCGGTLISARYVLTAGHCIGFIYQKHNVIRLGEMDIDEVNPNRLDVEIEKIIEHPEHDPFRKLNDIALIRLAQYVTFSEFIRPICISRPHEFFNSFDEGEMLEAAGWGFTEKNAPSSILLKFTLPFYNQDNCRRLYHDAGYQLDNSQMCAGGGRSDTCIGDSGGPLVARLRDQNNCMKHDYYLIGITSFGLDCGVRTVPGIYTNVSLFFDWIKANMEI